MSTQKRVSLRTVREVAAQQSEALQALGPVLRDLHTRVEDVAAAVAACRTHITEAEEVFVARSKQVRDDMAPLTRNLWGRLRWLLTGK